MTDITPDTPQNEPDSDPLDELMVAAQEMENILTKLATMAKSGGSQANFWDKCRVGMRKVSAWFVETEKALDRELPIAKLRFDLELEIKKEKERQNEIAKRQLA